MIKLTLFIDNTQLGFLQRRSVGAVPVRLHECVSIPLLLFHVFPPPPITDMDRRGGNSLLSLSHCPCTLLNTAASHRRTLLMSLPSDYTLLRLQLLSLRHHPHASGRIRPTSLVLGMIAGNSEMVRCWAFMEVCVPLT